MMKRILMIGGAGFIGANLRETLRRQGDWVGTLDPQAAALLVPESFTVPLHSTEQLEQLLQDNAVDTVIHLASSLLPSSNADAFHRELEQVIQPSLRLIDVCAKAAIRFVMFSSGGTVYGDAGAAAIAENHELAPKSCYGYAKIVMEDYVRLLGRAQGLQYLIVRPSNPYGQHQRLNGAQGFIAVALGKVLSREPLEIWGDGNAIRDYLDVRDLAGAVSALVHGNVGNVTLNVGSGVGHSVNDVLAIIQEATGERVETVQRPARATDVRRIVLNTRALSSLVDWRPRALETGVRDFFTHLKQRDA
jgi:UDP-glucose 4-epimerase